MKKISPGCNEEGWSAFIVCRGQERFVKGGKALTGCGATIQVTKNDLYLVHEHDMAGPRDEVRFTCPCGVENNVPDGSLFKDLPFKKDWKGQ